jgi:hypothetical protein
MSPLRGFGEFSCFVIRRLTPPGYMLPPLRG